jgi:hypothetical protein
MDTEKLISLIIGGIAVAGGLGIGAISVFVAVPATTREKLAKLEIKSKERMAMLEKGIDPAIIFKEPKRAGQDPMLWGLLLAGMGAGILLGYLLHLVTGWSQPILINSLAIGLGGLGLVLFALYIKRSEGRNLA